MHVFRVTLVAVVVCSGCATTPKWAAATTMAEERFPSRAEVQALLQKPPKLDTAKLNAEVVDTWELVGPFPSQLGALPVTPSSGWEKELINASPKLAQAMTEDHRCLAREVARFVAERKSFPGHSLQRFIEFRCGTTARSVHFNSITGEVPAGVTDDAWLAQWKAELGKMVGATTPDLAGIAAARAGTRGVVVLATSDAGALLGKPVPLTGTAQAPLQKVELRGRLGRGGAFRIAAVINHGTLETAECKTLDAVTPPEFAFECPVKAGDTRTVVEVAAFDEGRILGRKVVDFALWPAGDAPKTWSRPKGSTDVPAGLLAPRFIAEVNAMRARSGLSTLTESATQSATATKLAPYYFSEDRDALEADLIALAMLAGWDVGIDTVSSGFGNNLLSGTRDLSLFVEFLLDSPWQRRALTDKRATHIAVGAIEAPGALGALFATYVPMQAFDRKAAEIAVITRLNTLRLDRGLPLAQWTLWIEDEGARIEANLKSGRWNPRDASQHALNSTAEVAKGRVTGYVQLVDDLDHFQFPPEVLLRKDINVFLAVGTYKGEDWAQTRYVVCFVLAQKGDIETAQR